MNEVEYLTYKHNPPHLFMGDAKYFITASTYKKLPYLRSNLAKEKLLNSLHMAFKKVNWEIEDWVILENHYHLMTNVTSTPSVLPSVLREAHRFTALWIKKNISDIFSPNKSTKVFYNYWDSCITFERSYLTRLAYLWLNPVKHGLIERAEDWRFGSYYYRFRNDEAGITRLINEYPSDKVKVKDDF